MIEDESDSTINEDLAGSSSPVRKKAKLDLSSLGDPESATQCPICLDSWSSSGSHRLVSLSCGHLFGQLCIEKWLSSHNKCPTCNGFAKKSDIRQLYTKAIWTVQDDERENALRLYESEKVKRSHLEKLHLKTSMQCQLYASENSMMKKKISELENQLKVNTQMHSKSLKQHGFYSFSRSVLVSTERKANVLHSDPHSGMIAVSKKLEDSPNKHGVLKLSSMEGSHHEFVNLHSDQIRDMLFDPHGNTTLLSCSKSKEIKLTSLKSNNPVISYQAQKECWSCGWSAGNMFHMLCGLQNGEVLLFDIRNTREVVESISPITSAQRCPVISIASLPSPAQNGLEGLLISTLQCISFYKKGTDGKFTGSQLDTPTGALSMVSYESEQSQILASYKPGTRNPKERHVLMNFKVSASNVAQVDTVHTFEGGAAQHLRSRSCLIKCPDDDNHLLVCAGDQANTSVRIWSTKTFKQQQTWVCQKEDGPIIAMGPHRAAGIQYFLKSFLSTSSVKTTENELIDYLELSVRGGKGGSGCASTQHLPRNKVKPDGGDGGSGGCIIFKGSPLKHDFSHIPSEIRGHSGMHGSGSYQRGLRGKDTIIHVPMGSLIGCQQSQKILAEIRSVDELYKAAAGGRGGKGNFSISSEKASRSSSKNYMCRDSEDGHDGDIAELYLEMKIIADVGLVGLPNAGKSSILSAISAAKPKIASYPFTTLRPHVGVVHYDGYYRLTIADIPGLIEGSSLGYGLGISFLKHIERCLTLLYVVDMSDLDNEPTKTIGILEKELDSYKEGMTQRVTGIIANKIDLISGPEAIIELARNFPNYSVIPVSASEHKNISSIRNILEPLKKLYQIEKHS